MSLTLAIIWMFHVEQKISLWKIVKEITEVLEASDMTLYIKLGNHEVLPKYEFPIFNFPENILLTITIKI